MIGLWRRGKDVLPRVVFVTEILTHYRAPFHERVRELLNNEGIEYHLVFSRPIGLAADKRDTVDLEWATETSSTRFWGFVFQPILGYINESLIIVGQENKYLANYVLIVLGRIFHRKVAFFGHGRNFQAQNANSISERWKRFWATKVYWWFAYTDETARILESYGFPRERISVFNNSIDTSEIKRQRALLTQDVVDRLRGEVVSGSCNVGVYVGGLYHEKRIQFLIDAAREVRARVPDFHLIIIGSGPDVSLLRDVDEEWILYKGPVFGMRKTELLSLASVWMMPGLVGLAVLDSFAYGVPMVTCNLGFHSPEFSYLKGGINGIIVENPNDVSSFSDAVVRVLSDGALKSSLIAAGECASEFYSIEEMSRRFVSGVIASLERVAK